MWWAGEGSKKAQSRPVVVASFGVEDRVDVELARELVAAVERCAPKFPNRRGEGKAATMRVAQEIRKIEPFLKVLASRKLGLSAHLPPGPEREAILDALIRDKLAEPDGISRDLREEAILSSLRDHLST
ncbi:MAG: hypothetical protein KC420_05085 [Myxococcales bacterium]|nr:hypothetical protein [Myxococcales bacterium]MCB9566722.1 hypothetical protein [Myxococcales bacterium]MCB9704457.1 hypothetical protein [Myxococcales bacterium]